MAADDRHREPRRKLRAAIEGVGLGALIGAAVVAPWARGGFLLLLDWAPGPRGWRPRTGPALPTGPAFTVPMDALHALLGAASSWLPVFLVLVGACAGAYCLVEGPASARVVCGVAYAWNPFVFDRLAVGQLSVLAGYAVLPWLASAALRADTVRAAVLVGVLWALAASFTVHYVWIGGFLLLGVAIARRRELGRSIWIGSALAAVVMGALVGAWLLAEHAHREAGSAGVLTAFGTASDGTLGRSLGLLAEQGFWRTVVRRPAADLGPVFPLVAGVALSAAGLGLLAAAGTRRARAALSLAIAGLAGWVLAHGSAGPVGGLYRFAFDQVPGFAIMREAQKWDALVCLAVAFGLGSAAAAIARSRASRLAWLVVVLPIAFAPTLAWGLGGRIQTSRYPASWAAVRASFDEMDGDVIGLPWTQYALPGITGNRNVVSPLGSYFGGRVLTSRNAGVPGLPGDRGREGMIEVAVHDARENAARGEPVRLGRALRSLGITGVLALGDDDAVMLRQDPDLTMRARGEGVILLAVGTPR